VWYARYEWVGTEVVEYEEDLNDEELLNMILALLSALEGGVNERTGNEPHDGDGSLESARLLGLARHLDDARGCRRARGRVEAGERGRALSREGGGYGEALGEDEARSHCD
jgi:hypothetical protein